MADGKRKKILTYWKNVKATTGFRKFLTFLIFVGIASLFWLILALNDNIQEDMEVRVHIYNVPDSVTFIVDPPAEIHAMVRDKGTNLWRSATFGHAVMELNFREYAADGIFSVNRGELTAALKKVFGQSASLISASVDSIHTVYTTSPGKRVPVEVVLDMTPSVGKIISGKPRVEPSGVLVYGSRDVLDTISRVLTEKLRGVNIEDSKTYTVKLHKISGVKIQPPEVKVMVEVEQLVRKQVRVNIQIDNLPAGEDLLLFPSTANVEYYLPMSKFNLSNDKISVHVDYRDLESGSKQLPLHLGAHSKDMENVRLLDQTVEYTLVKD